MIRMSIEVVRTARAGATGLSLTILQQEEVEDIADFEKRVRYNF